MKKYSIVVLDEAHERSIYTDILFALVKQAVIKRAGTLRLVITSATLNTDQFSKYFSNCPVLKVFFLIFFTNRLKVDAIL